MRKKGTGGVNKEERESCVECVKSVHRERQKRVPKSPPLLPPFHLSPPPSCPPSHLHFFRTTSASRASGTTFFFGVFPAAGAEVFCRLGEEDEEEEEDDIEGEREGW